MVRDYCYIGQVVPDESPMCVSLVARVTTRQSTHPSIIYPVTNKTRLDEGRSADSDKKRQQESPN